MSLPSEPQVWRKDKFVISTDKHLISRNALNHAYAQDFMYWVTPLPDHVMQHIIDRSFCFGLYKYKEEYKEGDPLDPRTLEQIGFARFVTDDVTFVYMNDVYVLPEYQGLGLGGWLLDCVKEVISADLPYMRWVMLRTAHKKSEESYQTRLGMTVLGCNDSDEGPIMMGVKGEACKT